MKMLECVFLVRCMEKLGILRKTRESDVVSCGN